MTAFENIIDFFSKIPSLKFGITDFLDICLITFLIYNGIKLIRETRAFQLVKGLLLLGAAFAVISALEMQASSFVLSIVFQNIIIVLIVLFQQEIRQVLEKVGNSRFSGLIGFIKGNKSERKAVLSESIIEIAKAVFRMSESKTGSLIVMEKETLLGDVIKTGKPVDAQITHELIGNIFFPKSPLHDGAAVVREGRLHSAGCVLPLTRENVASDLGTRHRAAIGISEQSDAMVIVSSEETGIVSVAFKGNLTRNLSESELREMLMNYFVEESSEEGTSEGNIITKIFKGMKK